MTKSNFSYQQKVEIADLLLAGVPQTEVARRFSVQRGTISRLLKNEEFKQILGSRRDRQIDGSFSVNMDKHATTVADISDYPLQLSLYRRRRQIAAIACQNFAELFINKMEARLKTLDFEKISLKDLAAVVSAFGRSGSEMGDLFTKAGGAEAAILAIDKILSEIQKQERDS